MSHSKLTIQGVAIRAVHVPLRRPIVSKVGQFDRWPLILIDLQTREGVVGRSYLEPYLPHSIQYIVPAIRDLVERRIGQSVNPLGAFRDARRSLNLVGYEGIAMIAIAGLDMAEWDALAQMANMPLAGGRLCDA